MQCNPTTWQEELEIVTAPLTTQILHFTILVVLYSEMLLSDPLRFLSLVVAVFAFGFSHYFGEQKERTEHLLEACSEASTVLSIPSM